MPFVDRRVVSWGLGTADAQKCDRLEGKKILKDWARGFTPTVRFSAKKRGFYETVNDWWRGDRFEELSRVLTDNEAIRGWFRPSGMEALLAEQRKSQRAGRQLMTLLQFALWHRFFVESVTLTLLEVTDPLKLLFHQAPYYALSQCKVAPWSRASERWATAPCSRYTSFRDLRLLRQ